MTLADLHEPLLPIFAELAQWAHWPRNASVLDAGCGPGLKTALLAATLNQGSTIIGIDTDQTAVRAARQRLQPAGISAHWLAGNLQGLPLTDGTCDGIWCNAVLGLLDDPQAALAEFQRVLRPGGVVLVVTGTQAWSAVHQWPPAVAEALATAYQRGLMMGVIAPPANELCDGVAAQLGSAGFGAIATRAFLSDPFPSSPYAAELALAPWAMLRPTLAALLDATTIAAADAHAAAPEDADLVDMVLAAVGRTRELSL